MEPMERSEPLMVIRNQQVAGSIPAGGSNKIKNLIRTWFGHGWYFGRYFSVRWTGRWTSRLLSAPA